MEKVGYTAIFSIIFIWGGKKHYLALNWKCLASNWSISGCVFVLWRRMGPESSHFFHYFIIFYWKMPFQSGSQNPGLKGMKIKIFFLGGDSSFLEMKYLIDMWSEEERFTFICLTPASTQSKALQFATSSLPKTKRKNWNQTISSMEQANSAVM